MKQLDFDINIKPVEIKDEMKSAYIDYAMSVIVGRALPDIRDGLKPVHRRILFAMNDQGMTPGKPYKKSARVVGDVLGKYHPHGDTAVYDALVRMAQNFSLRYLLIDGQGNFGSVDGDSAAAMRYTEARMTRLAMELLADIDKETVDFTPNFDASLDEPVVLPAKFPNLLVNGTSGIAVGMATNIPPHNLHEIVDATVAMMDNPNITIEELMTNYVQGPDFPTGGIICGKRGIYDTYTTGRGIVKVKAKIEIEDVVGKKERKALIVTEIPYMVNKSNLIIKIADLVKEKKIPDIADIRDESDRKGMRIYIELKREANEDVVMNQLFKHTPLLSSFGCNMVALVDGQPQCLNLKVFIQKFIEHREVVIRRRTEFELKKALEKAHILEGLRIAIDHLDEVIALIRASADGESARIGLMSRFALSERQAQAILDMRLQKLTGLEREKLEQEYQETIAIIVDLRDILAHRERIFAIIKAELAEIKAKYGDKRRTLFDSELEDVDVSELIKEEKVVVFITKFGFVKRIPVDTFRTQLRGGRGIGGIQTRDDDSVEQMYTTSTHSALMCFTSAGKAYKTMVYRIPEATRQGKGISISHILSLSRDEVITAAVVVDNFECNDYLVMTTEAGVIKKTAVAEFKHLKNSNVIAIRLDDNDQLRWVKLTNGEQQLMIVSGQGMVIRFEEKQIRPLSRISRGVRGIKLNEKDRVVSMAVVSETDDLLLIAKSGIGKRTSMSEYKIQHRSGKGLQAIKLKNEDCLCGAKIVHAKDEIIIVTEKGVVSRQVVSKISRFRRGAKGVRIQKLDAKDKVIEFTVVPAGEDDELAKI